MTLIMISLFGEKGKKILDNYERMFYSIHMRNVCSKLGRICMAGEQIKEREVTIGVMKGSRNGKRRKIKGT